ncbi:zinc finger protein, partial [Oryctes borbonicus]
LYFANTSPQPVPCVCFSFQICMYQFRDSSVKAPTMCIIKTSTHWAIYFKLISVMEMERCFGSSSPLAIERPPSAHSSSRSSTPFTIPSFPSLATSLLEVGLMHPALLGEEMFRCSACMAAFPSIWLLEQHTALQHIGALGSIDKPFVCEQCGQSYRYRSAYVKHREQNHRARLPADKLFSCDVCGMQFRYLKSFKKHRLNHALERLHTGKTTTTTTTTTGIAESTTAGAAETQLNLNQQQQHQHTSTCCSSSSGNNLRDGDSNNSSMAMVVATDNNSSDQVSSSNETIGPLDNEEEGAMNDDHQVDQAVDLVEVKKETLDSSDERKTLPIDEDAEQDDTIDSIGGGACSSSGAAAAKSCSEEVAAAAFIRNAAQAEASIISFLRADAVERQRERRFACPFCGKCVRSKENLKLHVRKHTGERPFVCLFCGRAFGGKSDLTRHLRIHTGERPYHCDSCGKCFARADYLSKHLTTHLNSPR